jgi:hypothetical protein
MLPFATAFCLMSKLARRYKMRAGNALAPQAPGGGDG